MISGIKDFHFVDVSDYGLFLKEFESYPERAGAASGMPYDSLSDLDGKLDPPLKCLDPAWLTEIVRQVEALRAFGLDSFFPAVTPRKVAGAKQPPAVLKDFLEEARTAIRGWAEAWEKRECPRSVVIDPGVLPTSWTSIGAISLEWDAGGYIGDDGELPPGQYEAPAGSDLDPVASYRRLMAKAAVRDFLSVRLFDRKMPEDDPSVPEFSWTDANDGFGDDGWKTGVDVRVLSRQLLAAHSDCERASVLFLGMGRSSAVGPLDTFDISDRTNEYHEIGGRHRTNGDHPDCGEMVVGDGSAFSICYDNDRKDKTHVPLFDRCPPSSVPATSDPPSGFPVRYTKSVTKNSIDNAGHWCGYEDGTIHIVDDFWSLRTESEGKVEWSGLPAGMKFRVALPEWVEIEDAWVVMVAESRRLSSEYSTVGSRADMRVEALEYTDNSSGKLDSSLYVACVKASYDGTYLSVESIPDVPAPSGGVSVEIPGLPSRQSPAGTVAYRKRTKVEMDAAGVIQVLGAVVRVKFGASVKE